MNFSIKKYILYFPCFYIRHNLLKNLLYNFISKSLKNFLYFFFFYFLFSIFSLFLTKNLSLNFIYIVGEFTQESSWEILSPLQFPAHYVIQDGAEMDRISNHSLKYSSPPYHLFPSIRSEIFLSLLFFSLSLFFFHVIFFPLSSLHRVAIQMQERAVRWQQRTVQWRERLFRPFRRVKLPWVSENFIPFYYSGIIILDNYFLNPFHWVYT